MLMGVAGCLSESILSPSNAIAGTEVTVYRPGSDFAETAPDFTEPPRIEFKPSVEEVVVVGTLVVGSSRCTEAVVKTAEYSRDEEILRIAVGSGPTERNHDVCTGDQSVDAYRVVVTLEGVYPETVVATEVGTQGRRSKTEHLQTPIE